jgi:DNA topoisomerase I
VTVTGAALHFDYVAKEHLHRVTDVVDAGSARVVERLLGLSGADDDPLFRDVDALNGHPAIGSAAVNAYIHTLAGVPASAKEFRTWSGTVVAAATLAGAELPGATSSLRAAPAARAVRNAALLLGNSPAVAKASYVHPAVLAAGPDRRIQQAVAAFEAREGHRDVRLVWTDPGVQGAVTEQLSRTSTQP